MSKVLLEFPPLLTPGWSLQLEWKPQDLWVGVYWKNQPYRIDIWVCLLPCFPIHYASPIYEYEEEIKEETP